MHTETPLIIDVFKYLSFPFSKEFKENKIRLFKIFDIVRLWGAQFFLAIILGIITTFLTSLFSYDTTSNNEISELISNYDVLLMVFFVVIYAPITEELSFRMFLKYSPIRMGVGTVLFLYFIVEILDSLGLKTTSLLTDFFQESIQFFINIGFYITVLFVGLILGFIFKQFEERLKLKKIFSTTFPYLFYLTTLTFGFAHIGNYTNLKDIWFLAPIIVSPQILVGLLLGYVRVRYGLKYSVILHSMHNFLAYFPTAVLMLSTTSYKEMLSNSSFDPSSMSVSESMIIILVVLFFLFVIFLCFISLIQLIIEGLMYFINKH